MSNDDDDSITCDGLCYDCTGTTCSFCLKQIDIGAEKIEAARTKEIIEKLNGPATQIREHWAYFHWWQKNWKIANLNKKRAMLEA